jgi:RND family efflux transporter MFP subunit
MSRLKGFLARFQTWAQQKNSRYLMGAVLVILLGLGAYSYYQSVQAAGRAAAAAQSALKTAVVRRGNILISASGTGSVVAAAQANLGFQSGGTLAALNVKVGDQVKTGQVLAQQDGASQQAALASAQQNLDELTSPSALATARQAEATAQVSANNAYNTLAYTISAQVLHWEEKVAAARQDLHTAQLDARAAPSPEADQRLQAAQHSYDYAQQELAGAQLWYQKVYVPENFTMTDRRTGARTVNAPTDTTIKSARAALDLAKAQLVEAQDLITALTTGNIPDNATGASLLALKQAQASLVTARTNLKDTSLVSPIDGTVTSVSANLGDSVGATTIITVADLSRTYLTIYIDETDLSKLALGEEVDVSFDAYPNTSYTGRVTQIVPQLTTVDNVPAVQGQAVLDPAGASGPQLVFPVGLNATVQVVNARATNVLLVPIQALKQLEPGKYAVFVDQDGTLKLQVVEVGLMDTSYAEIKSGLQEGDLVTTGLSATASGSGSAQGNGQ